MTSREAPRRASREFFDRPPDEVAHDLVGAVMTVRRDEGAFVVRIVETEAYGGDDDPASHAYRGPTKRNTAMFGPAGHLYVYLSYGVHWCMNVVTQQREVASAVLLRGAEVLSAPESADATGATARAEFLRGPGNLTRGVGVNAHDNGRDCCAPLARVTFDVGALASGDNVARSQRIGISKARDRLSRYYLEGSLAVSRTPRTLGQ